MKKSVGLGLRHTFHDYVLKNKPSVPWFEVISENYLFFDGAPRRFLNEVRQNYPLVFHGVSLSIGSLDPIRMNYLQQLKKLISEIQPLWVSDHLCWTYNGPENSHDLLPVPLTKESLERIVDKISQAQDFLGQKMYFENPSAYVDFVGNEYPEAEFIKEMCERSGCGLMLDLNNLIVNKYNLGYDPIQYINTVKSCDVRQIHLAGHTIKEMVRIDTHDTDINHEALELLPLAKAYWPDVNPMIEWDDKIPPIEYLLSERNRIQSILDNANIATSTEAVVVQSQNVSPIDNSIVMNKFWELVKQEVPINESDIQRAEVFNTELPTPARIGMTVYNSAYSLRMLDVMKIDFPVLKTLLNEFFDDVILDYLKKYPSTYDSIDFVGNDLSNFIKENQFDYSLGVDKKIIADVAAFENLSSLAMISFAGNEPALVTSEFSEEDWSETQIKLKPNIYLYEADCSVHPVIKAVQQGEIPEVPDILKQYYLFYRDNETPYFKVLTEDEFSFFRFYKDFNTFYSFVEDKEEKFSEFATLLIENESFFSVNK